MVKPNILVVHGALGSAAQMEPVARALEAVGVVRNVELPGHGTTVLPPHHFDMPAFVAKLHDEVSHEVYSNNVAPLVFGYSMGGYVALALEAKYPGTFSGIVTLGTKFAWTPALALRECSRLNANAIAQKIPMFARTLEERHAEAGGWELVLERTAGLLEALGGQPLLTKESLGCVQARACIAVGEKDDTVGTDEAREFASYIPNATCFMVPDASHPIERVPVEAIVELLRTVADGARSLRGNRH